MNAVEQFISRWFDCDPSEQLPDSIQCLVHPFVLVCVFAGERAARTYLHRMFWLMTAHREMRA